MTAKTVTMPVIVASGLAMLGAPDAGADVTSPLQALVDAAARRLQTADPVAASNFRTGGQVDDPQREQQVIDAVTADAALAHIDAGYVHNVFRNQIDATDSLEHSRFAQWQDDAEAFNKRSLADTDYVHVWVDGIHLKVRLEADKVCLLVMIGVRADGSKELVDLAGGFRESSQSWADLLRSCRRRGMTAPVLTVGDGALGFWKALREVFPDTREQWCWFHVSSNVLAALPKSAHPGAKAALAQIHNAEDRDHALNAVKAFEADYGAKWPKAVAKITEHTEVLLAFYDYPAQHWIQLRTTNPIESTFATVRLRQRVTKGPGSRTAGIAMAYKLIEAAQSRWRAVNAPHLVALVRAGAKFENGKLIERPDETTTKEAAA